MGQIVVTPADIRMDFPEYSDPEVHPDSELESGIRKAGWYMSTATSSSVPTEKRKLMIELMACHMIWLGEHANRDASGSISGILAGAAIDAVSVNMAVPRYRGMFQYWLLQSPYGQQYLALVKSMSTPIYYGARRKENVL